MPNIAPKGEPNARKRKKNTPEIRVATPYFKPNSNQTDKKPDYYLYETDDWLVFHIAFGHAIVGKDHIAHDARVPVNRWSCRRQ